MSSNAIDWILLVGGMIGGLGFIIVLGLCYGGYITPTPAKSISFPVNTIMPTPVEWSLQTPYQDYIVTKPIILDSGILRADWHGSLIYASNYVLLEMTSIFSDDSPPKKHSSNQN